MTRLSVALIGAGFITLGAVSAAPAEAAQVTLDTCKQLQLNCTQLDYSGTVTVQSSLISLLANELSGLPGIVFSENQATATLSQSIIVDNLSGRLHDSGDTELTIPLSYAHDSFPNMFPGLFYGVSQLISLDSINMNGEVLNTQNQLLSSFDISYNKDTKEVVVDGYDFNQLKPCLNGICRINGAGFITTDVVPGTSSVRTDVSFSVTQVATPLPVTEPPSVPSVPEPSFLLGSLLAGGGLLKAKRQQKKK